jgi:glycosyltransferase involved in cell wall biosynthesis
MRGGERVLEQLCEAFPGADLFTHVYDPNLNSEIIRRHEVHCSTVASLPLARKYYKYYLGFMPAALEKLDLSAYDLVISSESGPAKGIIAPPTAKHICYCHSPMRYVWDNYHTYRKTLPLPARLIFDRTAHKIRQWDVTTAARVDRFIANSMFVAQRIERYYGRHAEVLHPPVDLDRFRPVADPRRDYYLVAGELIPYKRVDLAIEAFRSLDRRLVIAGRGSDARRLERNAPPNIEFAGRVSDQELASLYANCRALIFPGVEDFGLVPLEVMASGRPVIAFAAGGALESVKAPDCGLFFHEQTAEAIQNAISEFEQQEPRFSPAAARARAEEFSSAGFCRKFRELVEEELARPPSKRRDAVTSTARSQADCIAGPEP